MRPILYGVLVALFVAVGVVLQATQAQSDEICPQFVEQAITEVGDVCDNLGRNVACYGHYDVETVLYPGMSASRFDEPSDRIELAALNNIRTAPLNEEDERWGIALLSAQANLPQTAPGQNVVMLLVGDVELTNHVSPEMLTYTGETVDLLVQSDSVYYDEPSLVGHVAGQVVAGTSIQADLVSEDGQWVRVPQPEGNVLWVRSSIIANVNQLNALPHPNARQMSPMQSFYFNAGLGHANCSQASGTVFIQGPNNIRVDLEVNGAEISIGSTIALNYTDSRELQVTTLSGTAYVEGVAVPAGQSVWASVDAAGSVVDGTWQAPQVLDDNTARRYQMSERIPPGLLHYEIRMNETFPGLGQGNTSCPGNSCSNPGGSNAGNDACPGNSCDNPAQNGGCAGNSCDNPAQNGDCPGNSCDAGNPHGQTPNNPPPNNGGNDNANNGNAGGNGNNGNGGNAGGNGNGGNGNGG